MATALVMGNMIGSGLFLLPSTLAPYGGAALLGWGVSLAGALLLALVFARLGLEHPTRAGPQAYARIAFGDATGFAVAWSYWVSVWCGNAAIAVAFAGYFDSLLPARFASPAVAASTAIGALWLCTLTNARGVRSAGVVQLITTILKFLPLVLIAAAGIIWFDPAAWHPFNRSAESSTSVITSTVALTFFALTGMECVTVAGADVRDPQRTIPRATLIGTALAGVGTIVACMAVIGLVPAARLAVSPSPFAEATTRLWGPAAGTAVAVVAAISCYGALNGWTLMQGQVGRGAADDGWFPRVFARSDDRGTPVAGILISSALSSLLVLANFQKHLVALFTFVLLLTVAVNLVAYVVCSAAALKLHAPHRTRLRAIVQVSIGVLALAFSVWALIGTGAEALAWGAVLLLAGAPLYLWSKRRMAAPLPAIAPD